jgi:hypothetical protein
MTARKGIRYHQVVREIFLWLFPSCLLPAHAASVRIQPASRAKDAASNDQAKGESMKGIVIAAAVTVLLALGCFAGQKAYRMIQHFQKQQAQAIERVLSGS